MNVGSSPTVKGVVYFGRMSEWLMVTVLKAVVGQTTVGSNPTSSALENWQNWLLQRSGKP